MNASLWENLNISSFIGPILEALHYSERELLLVFQ